MRLWRHYTGGSLLLHLEKEESFGSTFVRRYLERNDQEAIAYQC